MTAYGRAESSLENKNIIVEIKSVNNRYFDCNIKISRMYGFLEEKIKSYIQANGISRGKVDVYVNINVLEAVGTEILLDQAYAENYINALFKLRDIFGLKDDISVMSVAQNRDIFNIIKPEEDTERDWQDLLPTLNASLEQYNQMRSDEGDNMQKDIIFKIEKIKELSKIISENSGVGAENYRLKLETKLTQTLADLNIEIDSARILTECALYADRTAIDEELVRLNSHFDAFDKMMKSREPIGRKLDFLVQEINREVNTIGSKANEYGIISHVIEIKSELEKIREQIQNIE